MQVLINPDLHDLSEVLAEQMPADTDQDTENPGSTLETPEDEEDQQEDEVSPEEAND